MEGNMADVSTEDRQRIEEIHSIKKKLGKSLVILTHHYQRMEIVDLGDYRGDSFGLSQKAAADRDARYIVFCGVHFMAESAEILSQPHQCVQIPDMEAGCWMADMANEVVAEEAWDAVTDIVGKEAVTPVVYMNADARIKAFCGRNGGIVCTSSNAEPALTWAFARRPKVFFFPDQHLGRNTGNRMGMAPEDMIVWNPEKPLGGNTAEAIERARLILWDGFCLVHTRFTAADMTDMRARYPDAKIVVHPECTQEVVALADAVGSTSFIVKYVEEAPSGAVILVGTEINLIERLSRQHPDKTVLPLRRSLCPNMYKINPENLLDTLRHLGEKNVVTVPEEVKADARLALNRMLELAGP
jgi:quinolinate synthase